MKEIQLTRDQVTLVDDEDYEWLIKWKWRALWNSKTRDFFAVRTDYSNNNKVCIIMSRLITACPEDKIVDHRNHKTLDNRRRNLRVCSHSQNQQNVSPQRNCTSKYKGVCWHIRDRIWQAYITAQDIFDQSIRIHLGSFKNEKEAAKAYDKAALKEFGKFAYLNFPGGE